MLENMVRPIKPPDRRVAQHPREVSPRATQEDSNPTFMQPAAIASIWVNASSKKKLP